MAEIKWIKITTDVFDDEKMKIIDTLPDRDAIIVTWFKLLALTGKKNERGLLFLSSKMPYTDEMLSTIFNRPLNTVRLALETFVNFGMIEVLDNKVISVINWDKHQNIDGMEKIKNQNLLRQRKSEIKRKLIEIGYKSNEADKIAEKEKENLPSNVITRYSNGTDKIRIELDKKNNNILEGEIVDVLPCNTENKKINSAVRQHLTMILKQYKLNISAEDVIKHSKGDIKAAEERIKHFADKGSGYVVAAIKGNYDIVEVKKDKEFITPIKTDLDVKDIEKRFLEGEL